MKHWTKQIVRIISIVCVVIAIAQIGLAKECVVTVSNTEWAPYTTEDSPANGIVPEIISAAYARQGDYKMKFVFYPWARVMFEMDNGSLDGAAAAFYRDERAKKYLYSDPYMVCPMAFYKQKDLPLTTWKSLEDLKTYTIGVILKSAYSPDFDKADFLRKDPVTEVLQNLEKLLLGRIDLMAADTFVAQYYIKKHYPDQQDEFVQISPNLYENSLHIMFSRNIPDAEQKLQAFNEGLKIIKEDGTLLKILEKYGMENSSVGQKTDTSNEPDTIHNAETD